MPSTGRGRVPNDPFQTHVRSSPRGHRADGLRRTSPRLRSPMTIRFRRSHRHRHLRLRRSRRARSTSRLPGRPPAAATRMRQRQRPALWPPTPPRASSRAQRATTTPCRSFRGAKARSTRSMRPPARSRTSRSKPGERLTGPGPIAAGDTARWIIGDTTSGAGRTARVHILVKPTRPDITTNLVSQHRPAHLPDRAARQRRDLDACCRMGLSG